MDSMRKRKRFPDGERIKQRKRNKRPDTSAHHSSYWGIPPPPHSSNTNRRQLKQEDSAGSLGAMTSMKQKKQNGIVRAMASMRQKKHRRMNKPGSSCNGTVSPLASTLEPRREEKHDTVNERTVFKAAIPANWASNAQQKEPRQNKRTFGTVSGNDNDTDNVDLGATTPPSRRKPKKKKIKKTPLNDHVSNGVEGKSASQQPTVHVGVDRVNSNWKQLLATLRKGGAAKRAQDMKLKEPAETAGKLEVKHVENVNRRQSEVLPPKDAIFRVTKVLAMDCEMVGAGFDGKRSILARVSLVNTSGNVVYDKYVKPMEPVTDYRTKISGIRANDLRNGENFTAVQKEVSELLLGRVLVGHSVQNDLKVMYLSHPKKDIRDTSTYPPLRGSSGQRQGLRSIAENVLGVAIQTGAHCSVQDARAAMFIYQYMKNKWEPFMLKKGHA